MKQNDESCEICGSENTRDKGNGILHCRDCGNFFESEALLVTQTKSRRKQKFDDDDRY